MSDVYTYTLEQMTETNAFTFHGNDFKVVCSHQNHPYHPSLWSHMDEVETRNLWWDIQPGDVVLDIGADFGSYTLTALACGASYVLAWSPAFKLPTQPLEAQTLRLSIFENAWENKATIHEGGLWSERGYMAGFDGPRPAQFYKTRNEALAAIAGQPGHVSVFPVTTLDDADLGEDYLDNDHHATPRIPGWIKIDTEGCELEILKGGVELIKRCKPRIILEHHYHIDPACETKCDAFLAELGYVKNGTIPHGEIAHSLYTHPEGR